MAIRVQHEVNPAYLGQGAYAGGLAQYDRAQEQLAMQQAQLNQRQIMADQQIRAQQMADQQRIQAAFAQDQQRAQLGMLEQQQQQQNVMERIQAEQDFATRQHQMANDTKLQLNEQEYALKEADRNRKIEWVLNSNWDDATKQNALDKINAEMTRFEVKPPPTLDEIVQQNVHEADGYIIIRDQDGNLNYKPKPHRLAGQDEPRMIAGREVQGARNAKGEWEPYNPDDLKPVDTSQQDAKAASEKAKQIDESYQRAVDQALATGHAPGTPQYTDAVKYYMAEEMRMKQAAMDGSLLQNPPALPQAQVPGQPPADPNAAAPEAQPQPGGIGDVFMPGMTPPPQPKPPEPTGPGGAMRPAAEDIANNRVDPAALQPNMFHVRSSPVFQQPMPAPGTPEFASRAHMLAEDARLLSAAYANNPDMIGSNREHIAIQRFIADEQKRLIEAMRAAQGQQQPQQPQQAPRQPAAQQQPEANPWQGMQEVVQNKPASIEQLKAEAMNLASRYNNDLNAMQESNPADWRRYQGLLEQIQRIQGGNQGAAG